MARSPQNSQSNFTELFNEITGLLRSVLISIDIIENIIEHKEKRYGSKFSQDLPVAIRTAFDAIFHDVSATVRSYFN